MSSRCFSSEHYNSSNVPRLTLWLNPQLGLSGFDQPSPEHCGAHSAKIRRSIPHSVANSIPNLVGSKPATQQSWSQVIGHVAFCWITVTLLSPSPFPRTQHCIGRGDRRMGLEMRPLSFMSWEWLWRRRNHSFNSRGIIHGSSAVSSPRLLQIPALLFGVDRFYTLQTKFRSCPQHPPSRVCTNCGVSCKQRCRDLPAGKPGSSPTAPLFRDPCRGSNCITWRQKVWAGGLLCKGVDFRFVRRNNLR